MDRKDVFYAGSLERLAAQQPTIDATPATRVSFVQPTNGCCLSCWTCLRLVAEYFDLDVLHTSRTLIVMTVAMAVFSLGQYTPYMFIVGTVFLEN